MKARLLAAALAAAPLPVLAQRAGETDVGAVTASQPPEATDLQITAHVYEPKVVDATPERQGRLRAPDGFRVEAWADGLGKPRVIAVGGDGTVYVTRREPGDLLMLRDTDGDGKADLRKVATARPRLHGIAVDGQTMYLAAVNEVYRATINDDGTITEPEPIITDLPDGGQHPNRTLAVGPDGMLYITVGSTCNACDETSQESATVLRAKPDGTSRTIYASRLRNTIGIDWHPRTGALWGMDHGIDWLGDDVQKEELNRIEQGNSYGWPYLYANNQENPADEPPDGVSVEAFKKMSTEPELLYTAHAAPMQLTFYEGRQFPREYRGDAFVTMRGSWNRKPASGYEVVRIRFNDEGKPQSFEPFLTGFLSPDEKGGDEVLGRPVGLAVMPDGSMLVGDDTKGIIYRVSHMGGAVARIDLPPDDQPQTDQSAADEVALATAAGRQGPPPGHGPTQVALRLPDLQPQARLEVSSPEIRPGGPIPDKYSEYGQAFSPPLSWSAGPEGTRSYVVLLESPDAPEPKPFIHWVAYDIPAGTTQIRGSLPGQPALTEPVALKQGPNSAGSIGYSGPKPPVGDGPHRYHFQVFALDRMLGLPPGATRAQVLEAMGGHVLAAGELVGTYAKAPS